MSERTTPIVGHMPHVVVPTPDGSVHVIPRVVMERIATGEMRIRALQNWRQIVRGIIADWLTRLRGETEDA